MSGLSLFLYCMGYYLLAGISISIGYHRALTHQSLVLSKWFERSIITLGLPAGTPIQWVGNHRYHHAHADHEQDPHSPVIDGFWYAHNGWYFDCKNPLLCFLYAVAGPLRTIYDGWNRPRTNRQYDHFADDIAKDPYYLWMSKPMVFFCALLIHVAVTYGLLFLVWGSWGIMALWITQTLIYNLGDAINSVAHLYGKRPFQTNHQARNHWFIGIFAAGEWHANHHTFPNSAQQGLLRWQIDWPWQFIKVLKRLGIASQIKRPEESQITQSLQD